MRVRSTSWLSAMALLATLASGASAQLSTPKRGADAGGGARCPAFQRPATPSPAARERARELTTLGHQAAITGDDRAARDLFRQGSEADPTDARLAYHLARSQESLGEAGEAMREYCRALALAPSGPDATDARERLTQVAAEARVLGPAADSVFRGGVAHLEQRRYREAVAAFGDVLRRAPEWEPAYYNRALASVAMKEPAKAVQDLERYLELAPDAPDRVAVAREIARLRRQSLSPGTALVVGALPGAGQLYTRRPLLGLLVAAGAGGATYFALREKSETRTGRFVDPFGNEREFQYTERVRPNLTVGVAAAAGITLLGALEAHLYARRARSAMERRPAPTRQAAERAVEPLLQPGIDGAMRLGLTLSFGGS